MTTKQERLNAAKESAARKLSSARKPRPERKALKTLTAAVEESDGSSALEPEPETAADSSPAAVLTLVEVEIPETPVVAAVAEPAAIAPSPAKPTTRAAKAPQLPTWRELARRPAERGQARSNPRLNVPCDETLIELLNQRDFTLNKEGHRYRINRSELLAAAIDVFGSAQEHWVGEWRATSEDAPTATTALQGRVDPQHQAALKDLRYLGADGKQVVNTGPILALIIRRILEAPA